MTEELHIYSNDYYLDMMQLVAVHIHILDGSMERKNHIGDKVCISQHTYGCKKDQALLIFNFLATLNGNCI